MHRRRNTVIALALGLGLALGANVGAAERTPARVDVGSGVLAVTPLVDSDGVSVRVSGPGGVLLARTFGGGESPVLGLAEAGGGSLPDGAYVYEVWLHRRAPADAAKLAAVREAQDTGAMPRYEAAPLVVSGSFRVLGGAVVGEVAEAQGPQAASKGGHAPGPGPTPDDFVINDDLIVLGSACVGLDCANGENFGFDTLRLKENNTRIRFFDTSASGSFPSNDWQLTANDSANGGLNKFSIDDIDGGRTPFTIEAGAPSNSLYVDDGGNLGLGTSTPVVDVHVVSGNTPTLRLEQNGSSGFTPQTWDVAGNEANFFIRDVTNGSKLSLRIRPGAPQSSIDISSTGNVGITNSAPTSALHVKRSDGTAKLTVEETSTAADRVLMVLQNAAPNNKSRFLIQSGDVVPGAWSLDNNGQALDSFSITRIGSGVNAFTLASNGNLTIGGTLTQNSDRDTKAGIDAVDAHAVLAKVSSLPISTWHLKSDKAQARHLGPMAQDFAAAFGLGEDERHIAPVDVGGVALAAIQALNEVVTEKQARIEALEARLARLEAALAEKQ